MGNVIGIGGVFFRASNPGALTDWYARHLGFEITSYGCSEFRPNSMPETSYTIWAPFSADTDYFNPSDKQFMINLIVDDVAAVLDKAAEGGAQIVGDIQKEPFGEFGWFIDPEGNKIELWKPMEEQVP